MDSEKSISSVRKSNRRMLAFALALLLCLSCLPGTARAADDTKAASVRLADTQGTVTVKDASAKSKTVRKDMRLYSGYTVTTGTKSSAWLSLDDTKTIQLDSSTSVEVRKSGTKLEVCLSYGNLFFDVSKPLEASESLNIRTSTMVCGIRGSSGFVGEEDAGMLHGHGFMICTDPTTGRSCTTDFVSGDYVRRDPSATGSAGSLEGTGFRQSQMTANDVPAVAAEALAGNQSLQDAIRRDVPTLDVQKVLDGAGDKRAEKNAQEEAAAAAAAEAARGQEGASVNRVWNAAGATGYFPITAPTLYTVHTSVNAERGSVAVFVNTTDATATQAKASDTVLLSVDAKPGWALSALTVTTAGGETLSYGMNGVGLRTFTMPTGDVTVTAEFIEAGWTVAAGAYIAAQISSLTLTDAVALSVTASDETELAAASGLTAGDDLEFTLPTDGSFTLKLTEGMPPYHGEMNVTAKVWYGPSGGSETETLCTAAVTGDTCVVTLPGIPAGNEIHSLIVYVTVTGEVPTYAVTTLSAEHGTVTADKESAAKGETVTLTLTPESAAYRAADVSVLAGQDSLIVETAYVSEGCYTFVMPGDTVSVAAAFAIVQHSVTFVDEDGTTVLKAATDYDYGTEAASIVQPTTPTKAPTAEKTFSFAGWTPALAAVTADATYKATYSDAVRTYQIVWKDSEGNTLKTDDLAWNATPAYDGATPAKDGWRFVGWRSGATLYAPGATLPSVTGDAAYQQEFVRLYAITTPGDATYTITTAVASETTPFAAAEDTVTLTVAAKPGYGLETDPPRIDYELDGAGHSDLAQYQEDDGNYTFTMPAASVTVHVTTSANEHLLTIPTSVENGTVTIDGKSVALDGRYTVRYNEEITLVLTGEATSTPPPRWTVSELSVTPELGGSVTGAFGDEETCKEGEWSYFSRTYTFRMPDDNVTVSAVFAQKTYHLSLADDITGGTLTLDKDTVTYGENIAITVTPEDGLELERMWLTDSEDNEITAWFSRDGAYYLEMPPQDATLHATFRGQTYGILYGVWDAPASMTALVEGKPISEFGDPESLRAPAGAEVTLIITGAEQPEATAPPYAVRAADATGEGGDAVTLTVVTDGLYASNSREVDGIPVTYHAYASTYTFTMPAEDVTIGASLEQGYYVRFDANGGSGTMDDDFATTDTGGGSVSYTLPACSFTAPGSKTFGGWEVNSVVYPAGETCSGFGGDILCKAIWNDA